MTGERKVRRVPLVISGRSLTGGKGVEKQEGARPTEMLLATQKDA